MAKPLHVKLSLTTMLASTTESAGSTQSTGTTGPATTTMLTSTTELTRAVTSKTMWPAMTTLSASITGSTSTMSYTRVPTALSTFNYTTSLPYFVNSSFVNDTYVNNTSLKNSFSLALAIATHIENAQAIIFSITGFFLAILVGFTCYEIFVVGKYCYQKRKPIEPIYATVSINRMANIRKLFARKNSEVVSSQADKTPDAIPRPISPPLPSLSFVERIAKLEIFFSKKKKP